MRTTTAIITVTLCGCAGPADDGDNNEPEPTWIDLRGVDEEPPATLSEIGLFVDPAVRENVHRAAVAYEPDWPLWSNGLQKSRYLVLPDGEHVSTDDGWTFPDGTLLFKQFDDAAGPVETRLMWKDPAEGWRWFAYVWEDGTDAVRTDGRRSVDVDVTVDGETYSHKVPNEIDCRKCHEPDGNGVLGFESVQLASSIEQLDVFEGEPSAEPVAHDDELTRDVLGWFVGNCTSCHNGLRNHDQSSFDLGPGAALENIVNVETESSASVDGTRIVPGSPADSVLFLAVSGESNDPELKLMPPVGVQRRDDVAVERLRTWIEELE